MQVIIENNIYEMSKTQAEKVISLAGKCLKRGIYAVSKGSYCELKKENYRSNEDLQKAIARYRKQGFKVYWNGEIKL